jgi:hypothetical protein
MIGRKNEIKPPFAELLRWLVNIMLAEMPRFGDIPDAHRALPEGAAVRVR